MNELEKLTACAGPLWESRLSLLGEAGEEAQRLLRQCGGEEEACFRYVLAFLPLSDLGDYDPSLLLRTVREALLARKRFPWCAALPERLFLLHVLPPRINTEELSDCRGLFRQALEDRVQGLSLPEAILEVNRWCGEHVTYRSTDDRTASALDVYRRGYGRCGEESTFTVTALRSVGIAARQVYAPWWSHCDDNHAWVEAWDGARWRYLGACEPEPELDRGWFTSAASRAMLIHSRAFAPQPALPLLFPDTDPIDLSVTEGVVYETVTQRYGETRPVTVSVLGRDGALLPNITVRFFVLNMANFREIAVRKTGQNGKAVLRLGLGSVLVSAMPNGPEALLEVSQTDHVSLTWGEPSEPESWREFAFRAPSGASGYPLPLSPALKRERRETLDRCAALREKYRPSNLPIITDRKTGLSLEQEDRVLSTLTEKDRAGEILPAVFADALPAFALEPQFPQEVFASALLSPRIGLEPLRPWRESLSAALPQRSRELFREEPGRLWTWLGEILRDSTAYSALSGTPAGAWKLKAANRPGREVLFCAFCRALGVPARLSPVDGAPEYWQAGSFHPVSPSEGSVLVLTALKQPALCGQNYRLSRQEGDRAVFLSTGDIPAGESRRLPLPVGRYRLLTVTRLPNGDQLARQADLTLHAGEEKSLSLSFREAEAADMLERLALPPFTLRSPSGTQVESGALLGGSPASLLFWLEPGREPTEHILNELCQSAQAVTAAGCPIHFIVEGPGLERDPTLARTLARLPQAKLWYGDFADTVPALARRLFLDPDKLPLALLTDCKANGLYGRSGYNVGTAELLVRLLKEVEKI